MLDIDFPDGFVDVYEDLPTDDKYWLAGIIEGEGTFVSSTNSYRVTFRILMIDEDIIQRVADILDCSVYGPIDQTRGGKNPSYKDAYEVRIRGGKAVSLMQELYPLMGKRRKQQIEEAVDSWEPTRSQRKLSKSQAREVYQRANSGKETYKEIAKDYPIGASSVCGIKQGNLYSNVLL